MVAEWITRGAGSRDSREVLTALDNLGVSHSESAQTLHTSMSAATLGRNLDPALEIFADMVLRPHFDDEEVEPIRALCLQNLRSLEDDPGTKVIYELRQRHFPDPWGRPSPGTTEGIAGLTPDALRSFYRSAYRPNGAILGVAGAIDWPRLQDAVGRLFGDWKPRPEPRLQEKPGGPRRDHIVRETQQIQIALAYPAATVASPDYYRARAAVGDPGGLFLGAAVHRGPREARAVLLGLRQLRGPARPGGPALLRRAPRPIAPRRPSTSCSPSSDRLGREGIELEELETMRAGLKSSLIMAQESSMSRSSSLASDWYFLGRVRPIEEISRRARRPDARVGLGLRRPGSRTSAT